MDLTSILPLLMGGKNPEMAKILSAMNGSKEGASGGGGMNDMLASILSSRNKEQAGTKNDGQSQSNTASNLNPLLGLMGAGGGGNSQTEMLMNLVSTMNKPKPSKAAGLSSIQKIAPNDILGVLLKFYNRHK